MLASRKYGCVYRGSRRPKRLDCMAIYANEIGVLRLHSYFERTLISSEDFTLATIYLFRFINAACFRVISQYCEKYCLEVPENGTSRQIIQPQHVDLFH